MHKDENYGKEVIRKQIQFSKTKWLVRGGFNDLDG